jgi:hypothetical protein
MRPEYWLYVCDDTVEIRNDASLAETLLFQPPISARFTKEKVDLAVNWIPIRSASVMILKALSGAAVNNK